MSKLYGKLPSLTLEQRSLFLVGLPSILFYIVFVVFFQRELLFHRKGHLFIHKGRCFMLVTTWAYLPGLEYRVLLIASYDVVVGLYWQIINQLLTFGASIE